MKERIEIQEDLKFDIQLALSEHSPDLARVVSSSKRNELPYRLVEDDWNAVGPPEGDWSELARMFKRSFLTLQAVELSAPYHFVRFAQLPPPHGPSLLANFHYDLAIANLEDTLIQE